MSNIPSWRTLVIPLVAAGLYFSPTYAEEVACSYTYGGEAKMLVAKPVESPYGVRTIAVGSYFRFRAVFQKSPADLASIKVYTYADRDEGPVLIHQASFPYPPSTAGKYGFTGLQFLYEPMREGELQYWCELRNSDKDGDE